MVTQVSTHNCSHFSLTCEQRIEGKPSRNKSLRSERGSISAGDRRRGVNELTSPGEWGGTYRSVDTYSVFRPQHAWFLPALSLAPVEGRRSFCGLLRLDVSDRGLTPPAAAHDVNVNSSGVNERTNRGAFWGRWGAVIDGWGRS